jgi:hypothetical protein
MAQQDVNPPRNGDRQYDETVDPKNPPNSVLQPAARTAALTSYLGGIIVLFVIVGLALVYRSASGRRIAQDPGERGDRTAQENREIGTAGERSPDPSSPGGFDPAARPGSTSDELEFRGADDRDAQRDLNARTSATKLSAVLDAAPTAAIGMPVDVRGITVANVDGGSFWIHDGNDKIEVVPPAGAAPVRTGQSVDVVGKVESDGRSGVRVRATRVNSR